jgi:glycosyltransferase involved in cell wall biosynthesis
MNSGDSRGGEATAAGARAARVSVGLPVYNGENFLAAAIDSVLAQSFRDLKLVISDNASSDRTQEICRRYAAADTRVEYHRAAVNGGIVWNCNQVFRLSSSEYFMWFSHDDVLAPTYLQRCVEVLDADPSAVLCFSACGDIDGEGRLIGERRSRFVMDSTDPVARFSAGICLDHWCEAWCGLTRSAIMRRTGLYGAYADYDRAMIAELGLYGRLIEIPEVLFLNREHANRYHQVHSTRFERSRLADPRNASSIVFPHFRQLRELWVAVSRSDLSPGDKARCRSELVRWATTYRRRLAADLDVAARETLRSMLRRPRTQP